MNRADHILEQLQQELGFVERERVAAGQSLLGEIGDRVLEMPRALAEREHFLAHALVDGVGVGEPRAHRIELALALALRGLPHVYALAGDTDGVDGQEEIAGAFVAPDTLVRAHAIGLHAGPMLDDNDAHTFFEALGDAIVTGPTRTNVNDYRAILVP